MRYRVKYQPEYVLQDSKMVEVPRIDLVIDATCVVCGKGMACFYRDRDMVYGVPTSELKEIVSE